MNQDEIIRMARAAGWQNTALLQADLPGLTKFAALVAAAEREACAKVCEHDVGMLGRGALGEFWTDKCAASIRARGQQ